MELKAKALGFAVVLLVIGPQVFGQPTDMGVAGPLRLGTQPLKMVDLPTAGMLPRGAFEIETDVYSDGAVLIRLGVGLAHYFSFGISYGGQNVIGSGDPLMNPEPAVNVKARLVEESLVMPAIAVGFDSQGYGQFFDEGKADGTDVGEERYLVKSRGIYAVVSKNWDLLGPLSLHGGLSYSLEDEKDNDPTGFVGVIKSFADFLDIRAEYDFAFNDNEGSWEIVENRGYFNASAVWHVNENFSMAIEIRDMATADRGELRIVDPDNPDETADLEDLRKWNRGLSITFHDFL
jgi:hypothetical protein